MKLIKQTPKSVLKSFLKKKPLRNEIEKFKIQLTQLLDRCNETESEEFHKNLIIDFLKNTYYEPNYYINTKGKNDLVIHNGINAKTKVAVIIEVKKQNNKAEMLSQTEINKKAFHELILYFLRERITLNNTELKHVIATNVNEWFIFNASLFDTLFAQNKSFVKQFKDFEEGRLSDIKTDFFYKSIAEPFIDNLKSDIPFTYFNFQDFQTPLRNLDNTDDNKLIALFKLLSPEHLLKLPFENDSNSLDKKFYSELLHIIGLVEIKEGSKKLITRNKEAERNSGSLIENAIIQLDSLDKISRLDKPHVFGSNNTERLFNVSLELTITWINRILFLKLLEAQLISYHKNKIAYSFLNIEKVKNYDDLNSLFFQVLAKKQNERNIDVRKLFEKIPYLNSSLFEPSEIEHATLFISNLKDDKTIPVYAQTVLKDKTGKKITGKLSALEYLFEFLNAYDFSSEGSEEIQEENKTLINASVLGLIFEKINGYKDGSFFTPGFITMYMCRETIRKAVVQKFNESKKWNCQNIEELYNKIEDTKQANQIINSLKICDPAVGSGHFLVSSLNEIIALKSELKILQDRNGKRLKEYSIEVENDELLIKDEDGDLFAYNPTNKESQRIQETLFHEKQSIIENCLFGVDINPNSVKICRLRLWIELLKNAYYKNETELETLPNIDINIKCGNSLVSRFAIDADLKQALKKSKWTIDSYRIAVDTYRNAESKEQKREMERLIADIKSDFRSEISRNDPKIKKLSKLNGELANLTQQQSLFALSTKERENWKKQVEKLTQETKKLETEIEEIKANKIFENAFEWRFEFPEVLNDDGDFVGFDVVIGNPPYVNFRDIKNVSEKIYFLSQFKVSEYQSDLFILFVELAFGISRKKGEFAFIIPNSITNNLNNSKVRKFILENAKLNSIVNTPIGVFPDATVDTVVLIATLENTIESAITVLQTNYSEVYATNKVKQSDFLKNENYYFDFLTSSENRNLLSKIEIDTIPLDKIADSSSGIKEYETGKGRPPQTENDRVEKVFNSKTKIDKTYRKHIQGNDVSTYALNWQGGYLKYGEWLAAPREAKYFEGERIIIREIPSKTKLIASFTDEDYTVKNTAHIFIIGKDYEAKYVVSLLNSLLFGYYFINKFSERDNVFPKAKIGQCRLLPIKICAKKQQRKFVDLVDKILLKKQEGKDTKSEENQIDQLIYQLYDLTEEEIKIIENATI
jgi:adenine-specific DNA-methyltransferase